MKWIVLREENGKIVLVSKQEEGSGLIYNGTYITVEDEENHRHILRVENSIQISPHSPSPLIVDMDLSPLVQDQVSKNQIQATRVMEIPERSDGMSGFIKPQTIARLSTQSEIDLALGSTHGFRVFLASAFGRNNQILKDYDGKFVV